MVLTTDIKLTKRGFLVATILFLFFFSWYYLFSLFVLRDVVGATGNTYPMVYTAFNIIIAITILIGGFFINRLKKLQIIYKSAFITSILSIFLLFTSRTVIGLMIALVTGVFFGIGQLASFAFFWSLTVSEERGRVAGLVGFFTLPIFYVINWIPEMFDFFTTVVLGIILSAAPFSIKLLRLEKKAILTNKKDEDENHPEKRTIVMYLVPWALFSLINATLAKNTSQFVIQSIPFSDYLALVVLQLGAAVFGALGGGIMADFFGRRTSLVLGLTFYGIGTALVGLVNNYLVFGLAYFANGLNWGILLTLFLSVVWGDLANRDNCAKMYSIGILIFYLTIGVGNLFAHQLSQIPLIVSSLVGCLLIFLSNIPLILAPELLSSDFREKIKLKLYMNIVRKLRKQSQDQG